MSIEDSQAIDIISTDPKTGTVTLSATDHLEWGNGEHLLAIQEKLNCYLSFIESGEIFESYPKAKNNELKIELVCKYEPDHDGIQFLQKCTEVIAGAGLVFNYAVHKN